MKISKDKLEALANVTATLVRYGALDIAKEVVDFVQKEAAKFEEVGEVG